MPKPYNDTQKSHKNVSLRFMPRVPLLKLLPYDKLMQFVKSVDIGNVRDMKISVVI